MYSLNKSYKSSGSLLIKPILLTIIFIITTLVCVAFVKAGESEPIIQTTASLSENVSDITEVSTTSSNTYTSLKGVTIKVFTPAKSSFVSSPLLITGEVPGNWSFEASFPIRLINNQGVVIAEVPAQLQGDWMTTNLVPFTATLNFTNPGNGEGTLLLVKDNPSGLAENDDSLSIPVKFAEQTTEEAIGK